MSLGDSCNTSFLLANRYTGRQALVLYLLFKYVQSSSHCFDRDCLKELACVRHYDLTFSFLLWHLGHEAVSIGVTKLEIALLILDAASFYLKAFHVGVACLM